MLPAMTCRPYSCQIVQFLVDHNGENPADWIKSTNIAQEKKTTLIQRTTEMITSDANKGMSRNQSLQRAAISIHL